jgi:anti-anti-sigma factor
MIPPLVVIEPVDGTPVPVVCVSGELDMANVHDALDTLLEHADSRSGLVVDVGELRYIDSAGVRTLVELAERLGRDGAQLALVVPEEARVGGVLSLVKIELLIPVHPTVDAALADFAAS